MKISYRPLVRIDLIEAKNPLYFPIKYENNVRTALLRQFPYHIHFFIDEARNRIVILAVVFAGKDFIDFTKR